MLGFVYDYPMRLIVAILALIESIRVVIPMCLNVATAINTEVIPKSMAVMDAALAREKKTPEVKVRELTASLTQNLTAATAASNNSEKQVVALEKANNQLKELKVQQGVADWAKNAVILTVPEPESELSIACSSLYIIEEYEPTSTDRFIADVPH